MFRLAAIAVALCLSCGPALAEVRALVVGVDLYASMQQLRGSANDARDLASELRQSGVTDLATLVDDQATMRNFDAAWNGIVGRAAPGDLVFLSFSGHGMRVPEQEAHTTPDGFQKGFLLQPYNAKSAPDEILRDENLYDRFAAATARGIKIMFVADACHAGAAVRGTDARSGARLRFQRFDTGTTPLAVAPQADKPVTTRPANPAVTVFSATDERLTIQEVVVDNDYRGALSYAVARGLRSVGGPVNVADLQRFVSPLVRVLSGNRQIPQFTIPDDTLNILGPATEPAASGDAAASPADTGTRVVAVQSDVAPSAPAPGGSLPQIGLSVVGSDNPPQFTGVAAGDAPATLIWDAARRQMLDANGDVLASGIGAADVQAAIDARRVVEALRADLATQPVDAGTRIGGAGNGDATRFFVRGDNVTISMRPGDFGYATMVDITASGTLQLMWPAAPEDPLDGAVSTVQSFEAPVTGPYGADYVITILSREPLNALQAALRALHNKADPLAFYAALREANSENDIRLGINAVFTCETLRSDGKCDTMLAL